MENELYHFGIKGMKWGVRRYQNKDGSLTAAGKKRQASANKHEDYTKVHSKANISSMSDAELRQRVNRLQMEQQYSKLSSSDVSKGKSYVNKAIKFGTTVATVTSTGLTIYNNFDRINKIISKTVKK